MVRRGNYEISLAEPVYSSQRDLAQQTLKAIIRDNECYNDQDLHMLFAQVFYFFQSDIFFGLYNVLK